MKLIPAPLHIVKNEGVFSLSSATFLYVEKGLESVGKLFNELVEKSIGCALCSGKGGVIFRLEPSFEPERYKIVITTSCLSVSCADEQGGFNALSTLRQLLDLDQKHARLCNVNCVIIDDSPRFSHRGVSLDIVRHWLGKEHILNFIDQMFLLKLNVLHLHLSDDQGYRIQSDVYPKLNEIGSYRQKSAIRDGTKNKYDETSYGGFLTKSEVAEIVDFALARGITVIPELDLPGHMVAAIASYPELSCCGKQLPVRCEWGISEDILCAGKDSTYAFVCNLLDEICELFPSKLIHLGGDEAPKKKWRKCPACRKKLSELNLKDFSQLQGYMFNYFADYLKQKGRQVIGWNECLNDNLADSVVVQHWTVPSMRSNKPTVNHINGGRKAIISYFIATYLDYPYAMTPMRKVYEFNPIFKGVKAVENVLGMECNIWCEHIADKDKFDYNVFPRIAAFAENAWTDKKDYDSFAERLVDYYKLLDGFGIKYAKNKEYEGKKLSTVVKFFTKDANIEIKSKKE